MKINNLINQHIKKLIPYKVINNPYKIKLDAQENPYDILLKLKNKILQETKKILFNRYPDSSSYELKKSIAKHYKVKTDQIFLGNGSDEIIMNILLAFGNSKTFVLSPEPSFSVYKILSNTLNIPYKGIPLDEKFDLDPKLFLSFKGILFLAYPNNPTGNCYSEEKIIYLLKHFSGIIIIDEAYAEFSNKTFLNYIDKYSNLIILKTFSKMFSLAGLRIGYLISNKKIVETLDKVRLPYNLNSFSQLAAKILIDNYKSLDKVKKTILKEKEILFKKLQEIKGIKAYPSEANFILFKTNKNNTYVWKELLKKEILIRKIDSYLRVTIGCPEENKKFIYSLREIQNENKKNK
ncbi:MAG: histidinol-phosphate transaminase [bacterium]